MCVCVCERSVLSRSSKISRVRRQSEQRFSMSHLTWVRTHKQTGAVAGMGMNRYEALFEGLSGVIKNTVILNSILSIAV